MNSHEIELRYLRYFVVLAEELNFRRSAGLLHITPSALSEIIQKLEGILAMKLFERTTTKVRLTAEGRVFLPKAHAMLAYVGETLEEVWTATQGSHETLHLAVCESWKTTIIPKAMEIYQKRFPNVEVFLTNVGMVDDGPQVFEKGRVHIRFSYALKTLPPKEVDYLTTFDLPLQVCMSADHPLAARKQVTLVEAAAQPLVLFHPFKHLNQDLLALFREHGLKPKAQTATSLDICLNMLASGRYITLLAVRPASALHNDPRLAHRPLKGVTPAPRMKGYALWKKNHPTPQTLHFIEILRQVSERQGY